MPRKRLRMPSSSDDIISAKRDILYRLVNATPAFWYEWGNAETQLLAKKLRAIAIEKPVYVTGLARAGTTILLELVASHPEVASHRYKDFPFLPILYSWRRYLQAFEKQGMSFPQERSHRDGLYVTSDSPEAFEEILWMRFFPGRHDETKNQSLDAAASNPAFETFYNNHIRTLLLVENASRYAAKGNYNISRLPYLHKLFPDARFVIAVRHPLAHIASLMKQHAWFRDAQQHNPALLRYMRQAGHFEFGLDRRPIRLQDDCAFETIRQAWKDGNELEGWALYWDYIYGHLIRLLQENPALAAHTRIITHESLCREPEATIPNLFTHCDLSLTPDLLEKWKGKLQLPTYYKAEFTETERSLVQRITARTASHFGYDF